MIKSFKDRETDKIFHLEFSKKLPPDIQRMAARKLKILHSAGTIDSLGVPPGNRLEPLKGARLGQYSIRINQQWRICFNWHEGNAFDVEITDYH